MYQWQYDNGYREFSEVVGKTFESVEGLTEGSDVVYFTFTDGSRYKMFHDQDCCESVSIVDVCGDLEDLIGGLVVEAREDVNTTDTFGREYLDDSFTWTFYNIQTTKGSVQIRWLGESNGYYSESVDFQLLTTQEKQ